MTEVDDYILTEDESYDVIIVGGGISGLIAARELKKSEPELKYKIVEAKDRLGGRTKTITLKTADGSDHWDIGGQWVGRTQRHLLELMKEIGVETYDQYSDGIKWMQIGQSKLRSYTSDLPKASEIGQYSIFELIHFLIAYPRLIKLVDTINLKNLHETPNAKELDALTVEEWFRQNGGNNRFFTDIGEVTTMSVYGVPSARMSMLYYLYYAKSAGRLEDLFECTNNGAQAFRIKGGTEQIVQKLASEIGEENVMLTSAVLEIDYSNDSKAMVLIQDRKNQTKIKAISGRRVIVACAPSECSRILFTPSMPYAKKQLFDGAPQGSLLKFIATYETPFWRAKGFSGEIVSSGATEFKGEVMPIVCVYDATTHHGSPALVGFIHNTFWSDQTFEFRKSGVLRDLARFLGDEALSPIDYIDKDWHLEPFSGGCPASVVPAGNMNSFLHIREPVSLIHFAGTETATEWMGYISGAVQAGKRAAHEVLLKLGSRNVDRKQLKDSIYATNYEPPRHWDRSYPPSGSCWCKFSKVIFATGILASGIFVAKRYFKLF